MKFNPNARQLKIVDLETSQILTHSYEGATLLLKQDRYALPIEVNVAHNAPAETIKAFNDAIEFNKTGFQPVVAVKLPEPVIGKENPIAKPVINLVANQNPTIPENNLNGQLDDNGNGGTYQNPIIDENTRKQEINADELEQLEVVAVNEENEERMSQLMEWSFKDLKKYATNLDVNITGLNSKEKVADAIIGAGV